MSAETPESLLELRFRSHPDRMSGVRSRLRKAIPLCGFDEQTTAEIVLAVGEACQNVMQHAYGKDEPGDIMVSLSRDEAALIVSVSDSAAPVDPTAVRPRALEDLRPGGLGTHFIEQLMDTVAFLPASDGVGNVLRMTKKMAVRS